MPAYAGGISLGYQPPDALAAEAVPMVEAGYKALKLRVGDNVKADIARMTAVRRRFGDDIVLLTDANTGYTVADVRQVMPAMDELNIGWLEEPFPAHDHRSYAMARGFGRTPLAAGENHYTRFEFHRVIEDGNITILQPDLSKSGGITEVQRIAAAASMWKLPIHPHSSMTGLNQAVSIHFLAVDRQWRLLRGRPVGRQQVPRRARQRAVADRQGRLRAAARQARHRRRDRREVPRWPIR